jgi:hypothetical protein
MWAITGVVVLSKLASHGFARRLKEAKAAFAAHWRQWLASGDHYSRGDAPGVSWSPSHSPALIRSLASWNNIVLNLAAAADSPA